MDKKPVTLKNIYTLLFFLGVFFIPFNDFEGLSFLGEYKNEAATYFFLGGFFVVCIEALLKTKLYFPIGSIYVQLILLFILWTLVTFILNYSSISESYFKQTGGVNRFIRQFISLIFSTIIFSALFWNVVRKNDIKSLFYRIRRVMLWSLILVFFYGFIEALIVIFNIEQFIPLFYFLDIFPFINGHLHTGNRISSVSYNVPALGNYLITVAPWMFSYFITSKKWFQRLSPLLIILLLTFFSGSRTALINVTLQFLLIGLFLISQRKIRERLYVILKYISPLFIVFLFLNGGTFFSTIYQKLDSLNFSKNLTESVSNKTRFGMQYASLRVFQESPIVGVGLGQETYHKRKYYPIWATENNHEFSTVFENEAIPSFPPAYNIYTRLLAETGIIGTFIFLFFLFVSTYSAYYYFLRLNGDYKIIALVIFVSFVGLFVNWLQTDFFRQYGVWLCLMLLIRLKGQVHLSYREIKTIK